ncbi:MAG TPA: ABC transporter permease [Rhizobiales bacterium]|nr:ABC transporter permease [Hyphomicrobiales bacterium]
MTMKKEKAHFWYTVNGRMLRAAWMRPEFKVGLIIFSLLLLLAVFMPLFSSVSATKISVHDRFMAPFFMKGGEWRHILGTDQLGRDLLLRSLIGLQNALLIGIFSVIGMFVLGALIGIVSGYRGRWLDTVLMRITDAQMSIPVVILAITILGVSRPTPLTVILVLVLAGWPTYARVIRSATMSEAKKEYVRAARIIGASHPRIMARHIAPNILPPVAFIGVLDVARMMIFEAILGFIGIGIQPPTPTFGNILADGTKYLINAWWITVIPGLFLFSALLSLNFIGSALEKARNDVLGGRN